MQGPDRGPCGLVSVSLLFVYTLQTSIFKLGMKMLCEVHILNLLLFYPAQMKIDRASCVHRGANDGD